MVFNKFNRRISLGFGTVLSIIITYFVYLYASEKGWGILAFAAKAYLIVYAVIAAIIIGIVLLALIILLISFLFFAGKFKYVKNNVYSKKQNVRKQKNYIDAEYEIKE